MSIEDFICFMFRVVLAAAFAEDTLFELRTALSIAEQEREGGKMKSEIDF